MSTFTLSQDRRMRVITVFCAAMVSLYALLVFIAEPTRSFAATASDTSDIQVTIAAGVSLSCDASLALGTITEDGDIGVYNAARDVTCNVRTNNSAGYTLGWQVSTGSGGSSTGYMINQFEDTLTPFNSTNTSTPTAWDSSSVPTTVAAWGGRLSSTSDAFATSPLTWGSDTGDNTEKWLKVATGSTITIAQNNAQTSAAGDNNLVGFRVQVGTAKIQPTGNYQATVSFTAATQ